MRFLTILLVFAAVGALAVADVQHKGTYRVVEIDDNGDRVENVWEFDGGSRAFLGVQVERTDDGLVVERVVDDSAAERAGLQKGDVLVSIDGEPLRRSRDLTAEILDREIGDRVRLEVLRDGRSITVDAELGEREGHFGLFAPGAHGFDSEEFEKKMAELHERLGNLDLDIQVPDFEFDFEGLEQLKHLEHLENFELPNLHLFTTRKPRLGVQLLQPTPELRDHYGAPEDAGVIVSKVLPDTPAEAAGVMVGDIILSADGKVVEDAGDLIRALGNVENDTVTLEILRDGAAITIDAYIEAPEEIEVPRGPRA